VSEQELFTLAVAIAVVVILGRGLANRLEVPEAIVLVVLGVLASLIPQVPNITLSPDIVLLVFVPPLIYNAAFLSAPRETRENAVPITALAIGATTVTILGVRLRSPRRSRRPTPSRPRRCCPGWARRTAW
jgi:CPA1 family monovalent cation:H+ antiporter